MGADSRLTTACVRHNFYLIRSCLRRFAHPRFTSASPILTRPHRALSPPHLCSPLLSLPLQLGPRHSKGDARVLGYPDSATIKMPSFDEKHQGVQNKPPVSKILPFASSQFLWEGSMAEGEAGAMLCRIGATTEPTKTAGLTSE
jgi:hypothetical protein